MLDRPTERHLQQRRVDLRPSFGQAKYLELTPLSTFGDELVVRSKGTNGAMPMGRVGTINLRSGRVRLLPVFIGVSGDIALRGQRLYVLQGPESGAWAYELPSLRRLARYALPGAHERRLKDATMGEPPACVAISADGKRLAFAESGTVRWYDVASTRLLGEPEVHQLGDYLTDATSSAASWRPRI